MRCVISCTLQSRGGTSRTTPSLCFPPAGCRPKSSSAAARGWRRSRSRTHRKTPTTAAAIPTCETETTHCPCFATLSLYKLRVMWLFVQVGVEQGLKAFDAKLKVMITEQPALQQAQAVSAAGATFVGIEMIAQVHPPLHRKCFLLCQYQKHTRDG